jgi:hypothetical protein
MFTAFVYDYITVRYVLVQTPFALIGGALPVKFNCSVEHCLSCSWIDHCQRCAQGFSLSSAGTCGTTNSTTNSTTNNSTTNTTTNSTNSTTTNSSSEGGGDGSIFGIIEISQTTAIAVLALINITIGVFLCKFSKETRT